MEFRELTPDEEQDFRAYTHEHWKWREDPSALWHPVVREEWHRMTSVAYDIIHVYQGIAPDMISSLEATGQELDLDTAMETTLTTFSTYANPDNVKLMATLPLDAKTRIAQQVLKEYI